VYFFVFILFFVFLQTKYQTYGKKQLYNTNAISQKYEIQKKRTKKNKIQNTKKNEPKISKIQNTKKNANFKMSQRANPMFILKSKNQLAK